MSPRIHCKGKHFTEIFCNELGYEIISYARSGFSNGGIAIQLNSAIREKPDFILFNLTTSDRVEISVTETSTKSEKEFNRLINIDQISDANSRPGELSDPFYVRNGRQVLVSGNLSSLLDDNKNNQLYFGTMVDSYPDWWTKIESLQSYHKNVYSEVWKRHVDTMMMYAVIHKLELSGIPYILVHDFLYLLCSEYRPSWINYKKETHSIVNDIRINYGPSFGQDPGFHLTFEGSQKVADILLTQYNNYFSGVA